MKNYPIIFCLLLTFLSFGQSRTINSKPQELSYEDKIAQKACIYLSKLDLIADPKQAIITSILRATDTVHMEDVEKKYTRDWTVEGIRGLNKKVSDLLIEKCSIVSQSD